eukprot:8148481-Lingulodinium_polyedra.AAC.1
MLRVSPHPPPVPAELALVWSSSPWRTAACSAGGWAAAPRAAAEALCRGPLHCRALRPRPLRATLPASPLACVGWRTWAPGR